MQKRKAIIIEHFLFLCFIDIPFESAIMKLSGHVSGNVNRSAGFAGNDLCEEYTGCTIGTGSLAVNYRSDGRTYLCVIQAQTECS